MKVNTCQVGVSGISAASHMDAKILLNCMRLVPAFNAMRYALEKSDAMCVKEHLRLHEAHSCKQKKNGCAQT